MTGLNYFHEDDAARSKAVKSPYSKDVEEFVNPGDKTQQPTIDRMPLRAKVRKIQKA